MTRDAFIEVKFEDLDPLEHCQGTQYPCENTNAEWTRQNTAYIYDMSNWAYVCPECAKALSKYWDEMWEAYYTGRL